MGSWAGSQRSGRRSDGVRRTYHGGRWGNTGFWSEELFFSTVSGYSSLSGSARSKDFVVEIWSGMETDLGDMLLGAKEIVLVIFLLFSFSLCLIALTCGFSICPCTNFIQKPKRRKCLNLLMAS